MKQIWLGRYMMLNRWKGPLGRAKKIKVHNREHETNNEFKIIYD